MAGCRHPQRNVVRGHRPERHQVSSCLRAHGAGRIPIIERILFMKRSAKQPIMLNITKTPGHTRQGVFFKCIPDFLFPVFFVGRPLHQHDAERDHAEPFFRPRFFRSAPPFLFGSFHKRHDAFRDVFDKLFSASHLCASPFAAVIGLAFAKPRVFKQSFPGINRGSLSHDLQRPSYTCIFFRQLRILKLCRNGLDQTLVHPDTFRKDGLNV